MRVLRLVPLQPRHERVPASGARHAELIVNQVTEYLLIQGIYFKILM